MPERDVVTIQLEDGTKVAAEVRMLRGEENISSSTYDMKDVCSKLHAIAKSLNTTVNELEPTKVSIEFGLEFALESGKLTSLIVSGTGTSSLKVNLEWDRSKKST